MRIRWLVVLAIVVLVLTQHGEGGKKAGKKGGKKAGKKKGKKALLGEIAELNATLTQCKDDLAKTLAECGADREELAKCNDDLGKIAQNCSDGREKLARCSADRENLAQRISRLENMRLLDVFIRSEGCEDPGKSDPCGVAYIKVNGTEYSPRERGHNVVVIDGQSGEFLESKSFDTHGNGASGGQLKGYLDSLTGDKWVLVAVQDESSHHEAPARPSLVRLGAQGPLITDYRHSFALVGYAGPGRKRNWVIQEQKGRGKGPSIIKTKVLLG